MAPIVLFKGLLRGIRPIIWFGQPVYLLYHPLKKVLSDRLSPAHAALLSEPVVSGDALDGNEEASWMTTHLQAPVPVTRLSADERERVFARLQEIKGDILELAGRLGQGASPEERRIADLLTQAIKVPGLGCVFVEGDLISFACWGFASDRPPRGESGDVDERVDVGSDRDIWEVMDVVRRHPAELTVELAEEDGTPGAGIPVRLKGGGEDRRQAAGPDGRAVFPDLPREIPLILEVAPPNRKPLTEKLTLKDHQAFRRLVLPPMPAPPPPPSVDLAVQVFWADGSPGRGVEVHLDSEQEFLSLTTEEDGTAEFMGLAPQAQGRIKVQAPDGRTAEQDFSLARKQNRITLILPEKETPTGTLAFVLENQQEQAVPGVNVTLKEGTRELKRESDSEGRAVFKGLALGRETRVVVRAPGRKITRQFTCTQEFEEHRITIFPPQYGWWKWLLAGLLALLLLLVIWTLWPKGPWFQDTASSRPGSSSGTPEGGKAPGAGSPAGGGGPSGSGVGAGGSGPSGLPASGPAGSGPGSDDGGTWAGAPSGTPGAGGGTSGSGGIPAGSGGGPGMPMAGGAGGGGDQGGFPAGGSGGSGMGVPGGSQGRDAGTLYPGQATGLPPSRLILPYSGSDQGPSRLPVGIWRSSDDLFNERTGQPVALYFRIEASGRGEIRFQEENGPVCPAPAKISFDGPRLVIDQLENAFCPGAKAYFRYLVTCDPGTDGTARCVMQNKDDQQNILDFELIRQQGSIPSR